MTKTFKSGEMIAVETPRGVTVAILAEELSYEKPCMVECKSILLYDGRLMVSQSNPVTVDLYIHQDAIDVRLANEQEGLRLFSEIKKAKGSKFSKLFDFALEVAMGGAHKSPSRWLPKDGDFVTTKWVGGSCTFIYKGSGQRDSEGAATYVGLNACGCIRLNAIFWLLDDSISFSKSTEEEKSRLLDAMKKEGLAWNPERSRVERIPWRAERGGLYWTVSCDPYRGETAFSPIRIEEFGTVDNYSDYASGDYHKTKEECQALCNKLNAALNENLENKKKL